MKFDSVLWMSKFFSIFKVRQEQGISLEVPPVVHLMQNIDLKSPTYGGQASAATGSAVGFGINRPGQRFCLTHVRFAQRVAVTTATRIIIIGLTVDGNLLNIFEEVYAVGAVGCTVYALPNPIFIDSNTDVVYTVSGGGAESSIMAIYGYYQ